MGKIILIHIIIVLWTIAEALTLSKENPCVTTKFMTIRGKYNVSYKDRLYKSFEGVPYAQPPISQNRFQPPVPIVKQLDHVVDATKVPNKCIQYDFENGQFSGEEDCLYLNIYVPIPRSENQSLLPVIIWFHEGGFQYGHGAYTKAKYLMDRDVILVTLNYRLGLFGFLSTEDNVVSGNMGLKDQNLAIRWVSDNIKFFGGDPKKISLFGASAGGSSVHYHYLSKSSAGLFSSGVSFSGTALSSWAYDPRPLVNTKILADTVSCSTESSVKMVDCLKNLDPHILTEASRQMLKKLTNLYYYYPLFMPVAEKNTSSYFIDHSPEEILRGGDVYDVPWTSGVVNQETAATAIGAIFNKTILSYTDKNWKNLAPYYLVYDKMVPAHTHAKVALASKRHYVQDENFNNKTQSVWGLTHLETDLTYFIILEKSVRLHAKVTKSPVYTYYYSHRAATSQTNRLPGTDFNRGACHLDDTYLVLENESIDPTKTIKDRAMLEVMLDLWFSVAATGKPCLKDAEIPRVDPNRSQFEYLHIAGPSNYFLRSSNNFGDKKFWSGVGFDLKT